MKLDLKEAQEHKVKLDLKAQPDLKEALDLKVQLETVSSPSEQCTFIHHLLLATVSVSVNVCVVALDLLEQLDISDRH